MAEADFHDEPRVIRASGNWRQRILIGVLLAGILLFIGSLALHPLWLQLRRWTVAEGPHGGPAYNIRWEGERHQVELFRQHNRIWVYLGSWQENFPTEIEIAIQGSEERFRSTLEFDGERQAFGPSRFQVAPVEDVPLRLRIKRDDELLWEGVRWSFRIR